MRRRGPLLVATLLTVAAAACSGSGSTGRTADRSPTSTASTTAPGPHDRADGTTAEVRTMRTPDGRSRTYRVVVPGRATGHAAPLLLALHGGIGSGAQFERSSGFDTLAARHGFVVVYPDGIEIGGASALARGHVWNGGGCCGPAAREQVDDVGFLTAVLDDVERLEQIDTARVYVTGHSNGAIMAYRLACERADRIAAIGVQAGSIEIPDCRPSRPVSVLAIHGTADRNIPIDGGRGQGLTAFTFSSPTVAVRTWATADGCGPSRTTTDPRNADVTTEAWTGCRDGTAVDFVRVRGANHAWMGHRAGAVQRRVVGTPYLRFDSTRAIWSFLAAHPRR